MDTETPRPLVLHVEISPHLAALCKDALDGYLRRDPAVGSLLTALLEGLVDVAAAMKARERVAVANNAASDDDDDEDPRAAIGALLRVLQASGQDQWITAIQLALMECPAILDCVNSYSSVECMLAEHYGVEEPFLETLLVYLEARGLPDIRVRANAVGWLDAAVLAWVQHRASLPRSAQHFTVSQVLQELNADQSKSTQVQVATLLRHVCAPSRQCRMDGVKARWWWPHAAGDVRPPPPPARG